MQWGRARGFGQDGISMLTEKSREAWMEWDDNRRKKEEETKNSGVDSKPTAAAAAAPSSSSSSSSSSSFECHDTIGLICLDAQGNW